MCNRNGQAEKLRRINQVANYVRISEMRPSVARMGLGAVFCSSISYLASSSREGNHLISIKLRCLEVIRCENLGGRKIESATSSRSLEPSAHRTEKSPASSAAQKFPRRVVS